MPKLPADKHTAEAASFVAIIWHETASVPSGFIVLPQPSEVSFVMQPPPQRFVNESIVSGGG